MDEGLRKAAQLGSIDFLYALIQDDADVLRRIDEMEFVDTPLHIAAAAGHSDFAMEMMNLKPSFARKLNRHGFSPVHLALQHQQTEIVLDFLSIDQDLARVKGREGYTLLHFAARYGNVNLLSQILDYCPNSILDLTIRKQTALHIAALNNRLEAFEAVFKWIIQRNPEDVGIRKRKILNLQDNDGNTVLHIAALHHQPQMIKLLIECKEVDRNVMNRRDLTAQVDCRESLNIFYRAKDQHSRLPRLSIFTKLTKEIEEMNVDTINALLVVFTLILSMTYQGVISPPGGVLQRETGRSNSSDDVGRSIVKPYTFVLFYTPNFMAFVIAWAMTISLLKVVAKNIALIVFLLYALMCLCFGVALAIIAPTDLTYWLALLVPWILNFLFFSIFLFRFKKS